MTSILTPDGLANQLCDNFAGWVFPNGGKSLIGSNLRIIIRKQQNVNESPHDQIKTAIKDSNACRASPNDESGLAMLYKGLREIKQDFALVQPLFVSVSGSSFQPGSYYLEHYLCPTERFSGMMSECECLVKDKAHYLKESPERDTLIETFDLLLFAQQSKKKGVLTANLLHSHSILHLSSADAGLKFKDRQAAKLSIDKRERTILSIVELLFN